MPVSLLNPRFSAVLAIGGAEAYRSVPDDDAEADDWEAIDPDPAELEEWDEPLADESYEDGCDDDDEDWDEADDWRDFDPSEDDDED
ncbi:MAG TPA: hypothetical protein VG433_12485 [Pirellulales bacterium]|jgi:hypothetical protein|nr:hypothetical protein [Pirellulales bacterium]